MDESEELLEESEEAGRPGVGGEGVWPELRRQRWKKL